MPPFSAVTDGFEKGEMDPQGYLGAGDKQKFRARDLTESRPHYGPFNLPETPL